MSDQPEIFRHPAKPEWGRGILIAEREQKLILHWEDGSEHALGAAFRGKLEPVALADEEAAALVESLLGARNRSLKAQERAKARPAKARASARRTPLVTFDEQLRRFDSLFPGGFEGETFMKYERGTNAENSLRYSKNPAMSRARELLAASQLTDGETGFNAGIELLGATNLVHPIEGAIRFRTLAEEHRAAWVESLRELLHGSGDYSARFDRYVDSLKVTASGGVPARPTWPLSTIFPALFAPGEHIFVKPKSLKEQAAILNLPLQYSPQPSGAVYQQFREVTSAVGERLQKAGHTPRDLMDVASFVWTTLSSKRAAATKSKKADTGSEAISAGAPKAPPEAPKAPADAPSASKAPEVTKARELAEAPEA